MSVGVAWPNGRYPNVLHVIASLAVGGTETQLTGFIARSTEPSRHRVAVFDRFGPLADRLPNQPIWLGRISRRPEEMAANLRTAVRLRRVVRQGAFDLVHAHLGLSEVLAVVVPRSVPVVASRRGQNLGFERNAALKLLEGLGHHRADILICNARYWAERAEREDRWTPPTRVIHNAIDPDEFPRTPMPTDDAPRVLVVANFHPYKRVDLFLRSFRLLRERLPEARATLVGDGVERACVEQLMTELGLDERVSLEGQVADPRPLVAAAHVVALTSETEGFPNALLEAMAQGRPVVATQVGGVSELVRDGQDGFLTSSDPAEIADRLHALLADGRLRLRMARSAHERASEFTWDRVVQETEDVYREVLARSRR